MRRAAPPLSPIAEAMAPSAYRIQAMVDGLDQAALAMERKWGVGRLRLLVPDFLRAKFGEQNTPKDIEERFEEAAATLRRLPDTRVPGDFSTWPPVIRSAVEAYGYDPARLPRIAPLPQAITRIEETFTWLTWLEPDDARVVWLRAEGVRWKPICWRVGLSRAAAWRRWVAALITIAHRLNSDYVKKGRKKGVTAAIDEARRDGLL